MHARRLWCGLSAAHRGCHGALSTRGPLRDTHAAGGRACGSACALTTLPHATIGPTPSIARIPETTRSRTRAQPRGAVGTYVTRRWHSRYGTIARLSCVQLWVIVRSRLEAGFGCSTQEQPCSRRSCCYKITNVKVMRIRGAELQPSWWCSLHLQRFGFAHVPRSCTSRAGQLAHAC